MASLSFFDLAWRLLLAGALALTPGMLFWTLVVGIWLVLRRLGQRLRLSRPASSAARP